MLHQYPELEQKIREFLAFNSDSNNNDLKRISSELKKINAEVQRLKIQNFNDILKSIEEQINNASKIYEEVPILKNANNPLTDDLCESVLTQLITEKRIDNRTLMLQKDVLRGDDEDDYKMTSCHNHYATIAAKNGLSLFVNYIENGEFDKISLDYYNELNKVGGIEQLKKYLNGDRMVSRDFITFLQKVGEQCYKAEYSGSEGRTLFNNDKNNDIFRIYLNTPKNEESIKFIAEFQIRCQQSGICYKMKPLYNSTKIKNEKDITVFYSSLEDLEKKLEIIDDLLKKYPNMKLGTPPSGTVTMTNLPNVGICHIGPLTRIAHPKTDRINEIQGGGTFNDYMDTLFQLAIVKTFYPLFINSQILSDDMKKKLKEETDTRYQFHDYLPELKVTFGDSDMVQKGKNLYNKLKQNSISTEEKKKLAEYTDKLKMIKIIQQELANPQRKKQIIGELKNNIQYYHNLINGFPLDSNHNIGIETWYVGEDINKNMQKVYDTSNHKKI